MHQGTEHSQIISVGRSKSISYANGRSRRVPNVSKSPLLTKTLESTHESSPHLTEDDQNVALHAPLHSTISTDSISVVKPASSAPTTRQTDLFNQDAINADAIPGNIHMSSNKSIEHLINRYGAVTLVRQLSADLAQREAELTLMRKRYSRKENALINLLQEMGFSKSQIDGLLKERMDSAASKEDDVSFIQNMISDAMEGGLDHTEESSVIVSPVPSQKTVKSSSASSLEDPNTTLTPHRRTRPHSLSSPPIPMTNPAHPASENAHPSSSSLLNAMSSMKIFNHVTQPFHEAIKPSHPKHKKLVPVEMENFDASLLPGDDHDGYVDQFGFLYDNNRQKRSSRGSMSTAAVSGSSSITSKLQEIANGYDKNQQQTNKEWDALIKKIALLNDDSTGDLLVVKGKSISHHKHLYHTFTKLVQQGIPMSYRPKIWAELSGSTHLKNPSEYHTLLHSTEANADAEPQIELDLYRTMPFNVFFKDNGPGLAKLQRILIAFSRKYRNIGYCQGMNFIVANLLLVYHSEEDAFWCFVGLMENILPEGFFNLGNIKHDLAQLKRNFKEQLPKLYAHFMEHDVELEPICFNWLMSLFTDSLSAHIVFRVWDMLMLNGYVEMQKTSIALFKIFEERLMTMNDNIEIYEFMKNLNKANFNLKGSELIKTSSGIGIDG